MNLRKRMLIFIALPVLAMFILVGVSSYMYSKKLLKEDMSQILTLTSDKYSLDIEHHIEEEKDILNFIANHFIYHRVPSNMMKQELQVLSSSYGGKEMFIGLPDGRFLDPRNKIKDTELDARTRPWFDEAKNTGDIVSSSPYTNVEGGLVTSISRSINYNGEFKGVLLTNIDLEGLLKFVKETTIEETGRILIIDKEGKVVAAKNYETGADLRTVENGDLSAVVQLLTNTDQKIIQFDVRGQKMFAAIDELEGMDWRLISMVPEAEILSHASTLLYFILFIVVGGLALLLGLILVISGHISKSAKGIADELAEMASYDLSLNEAKASHVYSKYKDEMGLMARSLLNFKLTMKELMSGINDLSSQVSASSEELTASSEQSANASTEIANAVDEIARGASTQADDVRRGADAMMEVERALLRNNEVLGSLTKTAELIGQAKDRGMVSVSDLVKATQESKEGAVQIYKVITETNEASQHIQQYTDMIKSIADQTNLLALNASIEAARAGEQGRGFAVVADEIKKLAEQTTDFTKEIDSNVAGLTSKTMGAVDTMGEVAKIVEKQSEKVIETKEQFDIIAKQIVLASEDVSSLNDTGSSIVEVQEVLNAILTSLQGLSQQNAASAQQSSASVQEQTATSEEIASASHNLAEMAEEMTNMIAKFRV